MTKFKLLFFGAMIISILTSCGYNDIPLTSDSSNIIENYSFFPIETYAVYEIYNSNSSNNIFDQTLLNNPIDKKMEEEMKTTNISNTRNSQVFFDGYVEIWKDELNFSINNLKQYLKKDEIEELEELQEIWEKGLQLNNQVDLNIMSSKGINLGTQYVNSSLLYVINQYRERVFHIKYVTMLAEECIPNPIAENERTWNKFSVD